MTQAHNDNAGRCLPPALKKTLEPRRCQACGASENMGRRKYCSRPCRQRLLFKLEVASCLLRALHARYATFSFTPDLLLFHVMAAGSPDVFSFFWKRTPGRKPADDLGDMIEHLGRQWWREHEKKRSRSQASLSVLSRGKPRVIDPEQVRPHATASPLVSQRNLSTLQLKKSAILGENAADAVKSAYRKQVMRHHPDRNGDAALFRKVHQAYEEMKEWLENPVVRSKRGLPDKWSYDGVRWAPPMKTQPEKPPPPPGS